VTKGTKGGTPWQHGGVAEAVTFVPFPPEDLDGWLKNSLIHYIDERVAAGDSPAEAEANAHASFERLFPHGSPAPGQRIGHLVSSEQTIGYLWIGVAGTDPERWWVWDIMIDEEFRGRGHGREAMLLAEELARREGASTIGLNVFGHNQVARRLYSSLGFRETSVQMRKDISSATVGRRARAAIDRG
jgi:ribosomal protein S18 acetylase RimI-like enzyme